MGCKLEAGWWETVSLLIKVIIEPLETKTFLGSKPLPVMTISIFLFWGRYKGMAEKLKSLTLTTPDTNTKTTNAEIIGKITGIITFLITGLV